MCITMRIFFIPGDAVGRRLGIVNFCFLQQLKALLEKYFTVYSL